MRDNGFNNIKLPDAYKRIPNMFFDNQIDRVKNIIAKGFAKGLEGMSIIIENTVITFSTNNV